MHTKLQLIFFNDKVKRKQDKNAVWKLMLLPVSSLDYIILDTNGRKENKKYRILARLFFKI